jgi:eukaryotic-like serine/threonine-protein kinase
MEVMEPERWKRLQEIFQAAQSLNPHARSTLLDRACVSDEALRREVESLLAADDRAVDDFLQNDVATLGMQILAHEEPGRTAMALLPIGTILDGRYEILEKLAEGGMGEVYKAHAQRLNILVVVKVLKEESLKHDWIVAKFRDEVTALAKLNDPGVVRILDAGALPNGSPYLVMQYVEGADLRQYIKAASGGMDLAQVAAMVKQASQGVAALHAAGLIHRDLKPENFMVQHKAGENCPMVQVIDLGIVRVLGTRTVLGQIVGTLLYMPPEQLEGQDVTPASDVYALGTMAYEMLTGELPFKSNNLAHLIELKKKGVKERPSALRPAVPEAADRVILKALSPSASQRQQSAREFGDELARVLTPQPLPPTPTGVDKRWVAAAAAAGVLAVFLVIALWWNLPSRALAREQVIDNLIANSPTAAAAPASGPVYDAEAAFPTGKPPQGMVYATIGFTVWRARPATTRDGADAARETIDSQEMASERIAETIADGDRIYLGIESLTGEFLPDKGGYLYVINREQYADGTFGRARLIFPTLLTYKGNNRVKPGQPIVLPETNRPFVIRRSSPAQVAESYTVILSPWKFQLPEPLGNKAMELPDNLLASWEKQYGGQTFRATLRNGVGQTRTKREQAIGSRATIDTAEPLTHSEPLPQTSYRNAVKIGNPAMATVALRFKD